LGLGIIGNKEWDWKKSLFFQGMFLLFVFITVPEHFLKEHLHDHIVKKHLFSFTNNPVSKNLYIILLIAVLIGII
jgi:hypothetical protein